MVNKASHRCVHDHCSATDNKVTWHMFATGDVTVIIVGAMLWLLLLAVLLIIIIYLCR